MQKIQDGIKRKHPAGEENTEFVDAVYSLFDEFRDIYQQKEWPRIDGCEEIYRGNHWFDVQHDVNDPTPTTPIIFSTIENIRADLTDEFPEAVIKPEDTGDELLSKILTEDVAQTLEATDYDAEYDRLTHDLLVGGWMAQETGWDEDACNGDGSAYIRHVSNKNIIFDPYCADIQKGRAVFKFERLPNEWFRQHYPKQYEFMRDDITTIDQNHDNFSNTTSPTETHYKILIEMWVRFYNKGKHEVHMVQLAGRQVLENSYLVKPNGYFAHGMYPFVVTPLYTQKGSPLGRGIVDMFKPAQQYSDKIDQIMLINAFLAGHERMYYNTQAVNVEDIADLSKQLIGVDGSLSETVRWEQTRPLPSHILMYRDSMRNSIKEESGSNDFSRGNVSSGVTAASAITALQEMSSKRSRMEARRIHYGFKEAVRMMIDVKREFDTAKREITITKDGEPVKVQVNKYTYQKLAGSRVIPIEYKISIKTARETKFTKLSNNQLTLEFAAMFQGQIDPAILMEAMDFEGQEVVLEKLRAASGKGIAALQQQIEQLTMAVQQMQAENGDLRGALTSAQNALGSMQGDIPEQI